MEKGKMVNCKKCGVAIEQGNFCLDCLSTKEEILPPSTGPPKGKILNSPPPPNSAPKNFSYEKANTYDELKNIFDNKVKELQERCPHTLITAWLQEYWAPAHSTGFEVRVCKICKKLIEKRP